MLYTVHCLKKKRKKVLSRKSLRRLWLPQNTVSTPAITVMVGFSSVLLIVFTTAAGQSTEYLSVPRQLSKDNAKSKGPSKFWFQNPPHLLTPNISLSTYVNKSSRSYRTETLIFSCIYSLHKIKPKTQKLISLVGNFLLCWIRVTVASI